MTLGSAMFGIISHFRAVVLGELLRDEGLLTRDWQLSPPSAPQLGTCPTRTSTCDTKTQEDLHGVSKSLPEIKEQVGSPTPPRPGCPAEEAGGLRLSGGMCHRETAPL